MRVLADALVLAIGDPALDEALRLAQSLTVGSVQQQRRRRVLEDAASTLRDQLHAIQRQLDETA